jgi:hypothetical protein
MAAVRLTEDTTPFVHTTLRARKWDLYNIHSAQIEASDNACSGFSAILTYKTSGCLALLPASIRPFDDIPLFPMLTLLPLLFPTSSSSNNPFSISLQ